MQRTSPQELVREAELRRKCGAPAPRRNAAASIAARAKPGAVWRDRIAGLADDALPEMVTLPPGTVSDGLAVERGAVERL